MWASSVRVPHPSQTGNREPPHKNVGEARGCHESAGQCKLHSDTLKPLSYGVAKIERHILFLSEALNQVSQRISRANLEFN